MAGDWIKFEVSTSDKPEVWSIAQSLGIDPDAVVGKLLRVWAWFDQHTESGNAPSVTKMLLDRSVGVSGFCDAVIAAGWMAEDDSGITLTNFDRHNGETAKKRALTAKRVAEHKKKKREGNAGDNAKGNAASVNGALPREDKREDISTTPPYPPKGGGSQKPPAFDPKAMPLPANIDYSAWCEWCNFRRKSKRKPITEAAAKKQLKLLAAYPPDVQRQIIETSITNDYQGLFPPGGGAKRQPETGREFLASRFDRGWAAGLIEPGSRDLDAVAEPRRLAHGGRQ